MSLIPPTCEDISEFHDEIVAVADYVFKHPGGAKAFNDCSRGDIIYTIISHIARKNAVVVFDANGRIHGVLLYTPDRARRVVYVAHAIGSRAVFLHFAGVWAKFYRGWDAEYLRRGVKKRMNFKQFTTRFGF